MAQTHPPLPPDALPAASALAAVLRDLLLAGLAVPPAVLQAVEACLGPHELQDLAQRLADPDDPEAAPMRELLLFPDEACALVVEAVLADAPCPTGCANELPRLLTGCRVTLHFPEAQSVALVLDATDAALFVTRLCLEQTLPEPVVAALDQEPPLDPQLCLRLRVRCRRLRPVWTPPTTTLATRILTGAPRLPGGTAELLPMLEWCLDFCAHTPLESLTEVPRALEERRRELEQRLLQAAELEKLREKHNFETRRMLGVAEPHLDPAALQRELFLLTLAARAAGIVLTSQATLLVERDLGTLDNADTLLQLLD